MNRISLLTTTRNRPELLLEAAQSVADQTLEPHEWIIYVDDDLNKYSSAIIKIKKDIPQVKIIHDGIVGRVKALNKAHEFITGDRVGLLDDDDLLDHQCIYLVKNFNYPLVYSDCDYLHKGENLIYKASTLDYTFQDNLDYQILFHFVCYDINLFRKVGGFDETFDTSMDHELYCRMTLECKPMRIPKILYYYQKQTDSIGSIHKEKQKFNVQRIKEKLLFLEQKQIQDRGLLDWDQVV